jgi:Tfp pilus assembly protein PilF
MLTPGRVPVILAVVALLCTVVAVAGCGGAEARRASHIARGERYLADGQLGKARIEFANALQITPGNAEARYLNGAVMERLGELAAAAAMYQGAIEVDPSHQQARAHLARIYLIAKQPDKALQVLAPALAAHPQDAGLLTTRALARAQLNDPQAISDAQRAVALAPDDPRAVATLAAFYAQAGESQRAIELVRTAIDRTPDSSDLRQTLAQLYIADGEEKLAEEQLAQIVRLRPKELQARLRLAAFYIRAGRPDDAERALAAAAAALSESQDAKLAYVEFLASDRPPARAESAIRDLIAAEPHNYELQLRLGDLEQRAGASPQALAIYRAVLAGSPGEATADAARDRIAALDVATGRLADARSLLARVITDNPRDNDALTLRGTIALQDGDAAAAISDLRVVLREQPRAVPVLRTLARAHLANGDGALAEENLRTALSVAPGDAGVRLDLGRFLVRANRPEEAVALLEEGVKAAPDAAGSALREALVEAYLARSDLPAARTAAEDLKALRPELAAGPYLAGLVAERQHRPEEARREFEHALQLQPTATDALAALGRLRYMRGEHAAAIALVRSAVERMPTNAAGQELLGELYLADQQYRPAVAALSEAVRIAPAWWLPYRNLARAKLAQRDVAGGGAAYEAGVKATQEPALAIDLAQFYVGQGRIEDAIRSYEKLNERKPRLEVVANNLAMLLVSYHNDQASLDRARDLTAGFASSSVGAFLDTHGWVLFKRGELAQALPALQRAAADAPGSRVILYHLGMAQLQAGQAAQARTSLAAALAGGASFTGTAEARLALAQLEGHSG